LVNNYQGSHAHSPTYDDTGSLLYMTNTVWHFSSARLSYKRTPLN